MVKNQTSAAIIALLLCAAVGATDLKADGRDIKSIRRCPADETQKGISILESRQGEDSWSAESKQALNLLFECADARFVSEKRMVSSGGETFSIVSYELDALGISLEYSTRGFIGLKHLPGKN